jgi:hypothetical protein
MQSTALLVLACVLLAIPGSLAVTGTLYSDTVCQNYYASQSGLQNNLCYPISVAYDGVIAQSGKIVCTSQGQATSTFFSDTSCQSAVAQATGAGDGSTCLQITKSSSGTILASGKVNCNSALTTYGISFTLLASLLLTAFSAHVLL